MGGGGEWEPASLLPNSAVRFADTKKIFKMSLSFIFYHTAVRVRLLMLERLLEPHFQSLAVLVIVPGADYLPDSDGICDFIELFFHGVAPRVQP